VSSTNHEAFDSATFSILLLFHSVISTPLGNKLGSLFTSCLLT